MDDLFLNKTPPDALDKWCYGKAMVHIFRDLPGHDYVEFYDAFEILQQCRDTHEMHRRFNIPSSCKNKTVAEMVRAVSTLGNSYYIDILSLFGILEKGLMAHGSGFFRRADSRTDMHTLFNLGYAEFLKGVG
jgi:hypothetical protein